MVRHVVWDWNGTLLADQSAVLDALNVMLAGMGRPTVDVATYRRLYTRPVRVFYERLLGEPVDDEWWGRIDRAFHDAYFEVVARMRLDDHARRALDVVAGTGRSQSLLSMAPHDHVVDMVAHHEIDHHFVRIDGLRGEGGGHKERWLRAHLDALSVSSADDVLMVGDALDDAAAAAAVGTRMVLFDGGSHPAAELASLGVPVVDTLLDALEVAGVQPARA